MCNRENILRLSIRRICLCVVGILIALLISEVGLVVAQSSEPPITEVAETQSVKVVAFFFVLLVLATILNRLVEIFMIFLKWLWPRWKFLNRIWLFLWNRIENKLHEIDSRLTEGKNLQELKEKARVMFIQILLFIFASSIGVLVCIQLRLGMLQQLKLISTSSVLDQILTGILAGSGTEPIHALFRILQSKKEVKKLSAMLGKP
ncbi:hypothetical protein DRQ15_00955 [candidate division KSB1 bacterium]|nr:MAG: hypothetical protein B5M50_04045 [candidate division KSB1 bacterium 4484_219]RKY79881.1 MAG: hypothetical protein DRQ00_02845 [candidate division KSB1 bacterium]RKY92890.1 MAG: hypothetical protein DRQ15_00955 [candidate division KSB1 bacterium]